MDSSLKLLSVVGGLKEMVDVLKPKEQSFKSIDDVLKSEEKPIKEEEAEDENSYQRNKSRIEFCFWNSTRWRLAIRDGIFCFQYDEEFLQTNLEISLIILPLQRDVIELPRDPVEGLAQNNGRYHQTETCAAFRQKVRRF